MLLSKVGFRRWSRFHAGHAIVGLFFVAESSFTVEHIPVSLHQKNHRKTYGCSYGRVSRSKLRAQLLKNCEEAGVRFLAGEVESISCAQGASASRLSLTDGTVLHSRYLTICQYPWESLLKTAATLVLMDAL